MKFITNQLLKGKFQFLVVIGFLIITNGAYCQQAQTNSNSAQMNKEIPEMVLKYLDWAGVDENSNFTEVVIHQEGKIKAKPDGKWMDLKAKGNFYVMKPEYHWKAKAATFSIVDDLSENKSHKTGKALGIFNIFNIKGHEESDQSALLRYLSELPWMPTAFLSENVLLEKEGKNRVRASLMKTPMVVTGIFYFDNNGKIERFEAERYRHDDGKFHLEKWSVEYDDYETFANLKIPTEAGVTWESKDGEFEYFKLTDITLYQPK